MGGDTWSEIGHVCSQNTGRPAPASEGWKADRHEVGKQPALIVLEEIQTTAELRQLPRVLPAAVRSNLPQEASVHSVTRATSNTRMLVPDLLWLQSDKYIYVFVP
jgi:hypothetical protein